MFKGLSEDGASIYTEHRTLWIYTAVPLPFGAEKKSPTVSISVCVVWWVCHIPSSINCAELSLIAFIDSSSHGPRADRIKCQQQKQRCFIWCHNEEKLETHTPWRLWNRISRSPLVLNGNHRVCSPLSFHPMENVASREEILFPMEVSVPLRGHITHQSHRERGIRSNI